MSVATVCLGDVATFVRGVTFKPEDVVPLGTPNSVACMRTKNVQVSLDVSDLWAIPETLVKRSDQILKPGDLLVSSANSWNLVGKCCWIPELPWRATFGGFVSVLRGLNGHIDPRYLYHWFASPHVQATVRSFGQQTTNISNLNVERCLNLRFSVPTIAEQRRVAEILDKADALRAKRRAAIALLDTLRECIFLDMFGDPVTNPKQWPVRTIGDLLDSATYGTSQKADLVGDLPVLRMNNITRQGEMDFSDLKYIRLNGDQRVRYSVRAGDILFNRTNSVDLVGKTAVYRESREVAFAGYLIRLRVNAQNDSEYVSAFLNTEYSKRVLRGMCKSIIGMANINATELQGTKIPQPPLQLQQEFARRLAAIERAKRTHRASLAQFDSLFASLQHRAFRGEL